MQVINLLEFDRAGLRSYFAELGEKPYHGDQVFKWIHQQGVTDIGSITNLSKKLRETLQTNAEIGLPTIVRQQNSKDGTIKWLLQLFDGNCIETVYIPESGRGTLCVSSQVGCVLNCSFCSTARQGFNRNLSVAEIIGQLWLAVRLLSSDKTRHDHAVTNVVLMGMGEPLLNFDNVVKAMDIMMDDFAYGLSKYRVTLSTSGVVPAMRQLAMVSEVSLAVSLHAPNNELRNQLVPLNKKYPLEELMQVCKEYFTFRTETKRQITMEYVMLEGVNDQEQHAQELVKILRGVPAKVNLIPFNPFPCAPYRCSADHVINRFRKLLLDAGINTITRKTRGEDIDAACGQLVGQVIDKTHRSEQYKKIADEG